MTESSTLFIKTCLLVDESLAIHRIRETVFQSEQNISPVLEWDGLDEQCIHLVAKLDDDCVGVGRLREIKEAKTLKLERLAVLSEYRRQGIGSEIVYTAIAYSKAQGYQHMIIHAQASTIEFYERLGFGRIGDTFYEANIEHIKMEKDLAKE
jgi:predicted GNAT family N-acyltransferase